MSSNTSGEGDIRKAIIEDDLVDCMVALPGQLFYSTQIPVCLWFLTRDKNVGAGLGDHGSKSSKNQTRPYGRNRRGEVLFIDARKLGTLTDRVHRDLSDEDIAQIADTYHAWKSEGRGGSALQAMTVDPTVKTSGKRPAPIMETRPYEDVPGFCKSVTLEDIRAQGYVLTPGRYVGAAEFEEDDEPFEQKMARLTKELEAQFEESDELKRQIRKNLKNLAGV